MPVALIGAGAIARTIADYAAVHRTFEVVAVLSRAIARDASRWPASLLVANRLAMLERKPNLVVECASHSAVREHVPAILEQGIDAIVASSGALADPLLSERIELATAGAQLIVPPGALGGVDALAAAARDSLGHVRLISTKPPAGWVGTPGEEAAAQATISCVLFHGTAREAARLYPRNANVAATVALAGMGFDRTEVQLIADPAARGNTHRLEVRGAFGRFSAEIDGAASAANPRTSRLTAYSIVRAIEQRTTGMVI